MKNRSLVMLVFSLTSGLFAASALADETKDSQEEADSAQPAAKSETEKPKAKAGKPPIAWCSLYENFKYLTGEFDKLVEVPQAMGAPFQYQRATDKLDRVGLGTGVSCNYSNRSRFTLGIGTELYVGRLDFHHEQSSLKGTASYIELGFKEWVKGTLNLNGVKLSSTLGVEKTNSSGFTLKNLQMDFGGGYLNLTKFGSEHLQSDGELEIWEARLDVEFPFRRKFSFGFGALYQKPHVLVRVKVDDEARRTLEAFNYDVNKVEREYDHTSNFFYLTPGLKWRGERLGISLTVPWGVFLAKQWSWGAELNTELKF